MKKKDIEKTLSDAVFAVMPTDMFENIEKRLDPEKERIVTMKEVKNSKRKPKLIAVIAAACAILIVGIFGGLLYSNNYAIDSVIDIDVNPCIEMKTNKKNIVREVNAINSDGEKVLDGMNLKGSDVKVAVNALIGSMVRSGYLTDNYNGILVTVSNSNEDKATALKNEITVNIGKALDENSVNAAVFNQTATDMAFARDFAKKNGISSGKAMFVLKLAEKDTTLKAEDLAKMNLRQLAKLVAEKNIEIGDIIEIEADDSLLENIKDGIEDLDENDKKEYYESGSAITLEKAKTVALAHAGVKTADATFTKTKLDDGKYEIEFLSGNIEYEYDIDAQTGRIISYETENRATGQKTAITPVSSTVITADKAREIAFTYAGVKESSATKIKTELDDGKYEVEFVCAGTEYEVEIDAVSGKITSFKAETDDDKTTSSTPQKTLAEAKKIALTHAKLNENSVKFTKAKLDDGKYEIEFVTSDATYKYEISASSGSITEFEKEPFQTNGHGTATASIESVKKAALAHSGLTGKSVTFKKAEVEDDGFEIEFVYGGYEYEYEFTPTGKLVSFDREPIDD